MAETAFLFPGQGAQKVGMGKDFADAFPAAARVFEEADETLGWGVGLLCFEGPQEELNRTAISQPVILTTSLAIVAALGEANHPAVRDCTAAAGLSLGEYSALVMAGAMTFADALRLVEKRGRFMEEAGRENPGTMCSVLGLDDETVEAICAEAREVGVVVAANYNCPGQAVVSGCHEAVERAGELARERGAKRVVPLAVSGAFHSPLMEPAARRLAEALEDVPIAPCNKRVIANATGGPVASADEVRDALARQVKSPVRWVQSMRKLMDCGYTQFVEVGPGKVLTGLMRRISRECEVKNISTADTLHADAA